MSLIISMQGRQGFVRYSTTPFTTLQANKRSQINEFSVKSAGRIRRYLRTCTADYSLLGTLTYPESYPTDGKEVKRHLASFIKRFRRKVEKSYRQDDACRFSFFWFLEFQERGAPHFHFFATHLPSDSNDVDDYQRARIEHGKSWIDPGKARIITARRWLAKAWYECVDSKDVRHLSAGTQLDYFKSGRGGSIKYATKYALKQKQKKKPENFENIGRWWGVSGWKFAVSATLVVSDRSMRHPDFVGANSTYKSWLETYKRDGLIDLKRDGHGEITGFYCKTDEAVRVVWKRLNLVLSKMIPIGEACLYDCEIASGIEEEYG